MTNDRNFNREVDVVNFRRAQVRLQKEAGKPVAIAGVRMLLTVWRSHLLKQPSSLAPAELVAAPKEKA